MTSHGQHRVWQRVLTLLSVLAVFIGFAPHGANPASARSSVSLAPTPLPELRSALLPPLVPQDLGEAPALPAGAAPLPREAAQEGLQARPGHAPAPRTQSGVRQVAGG